MSNFYVDGNSSATTFVPVPPGSHVARCYRIVDLGTQKTEYLGQLKYLRKVMFGWELHGEDNDGKPLVTEKNEPMAIFKNYTLSLNEKAHLRLDLQSWRGKPFSDAEATRFDIATVLGAWCMLNVIHRPGKDDKVFANVAGVSPIPAIVKQYGLPEGINELQMFRLADPDMEMFETFSKGLKAKIESSPEWQALVTRKGSPQASFSPAQAPVKGGFDDMEDDIPF